MSAFDRRQVLAMLGTSLLGMPLLGEPAAAQGAIAAPGDFKGQVFVTERGGVRVHTYMADPGGALVTSHIVETRQGLVVVDGQFVMPAALELKRYIAALGSPVARAILSHAHPDHWFGFAAAGIGEVHAGPITAAFIAQRGAAVVAERKADTTAPRIAGTIAAGEETIGGVTFRFRPVLDTEAPEIMTVELPQAGVLIAQDLVYNRVHAVVSRQIGQWVGVLKELEIRGGATPVILGGHGEPAAPGDLPGLVAYLEAVRPLLEANLGREDQARPIAEQVARAYPAYRLPPLLALGLSRALKG